MPTTGFHEYIEFEIELSTKSAMADNLTSELFKSPPKSTGPDAKKARPFDFVFFATVRLCAYIAAFEIYVQTPSMAAERIDFSAPYQISIGPDFPGNDPSVVRMQGHEHLSWRENGFAPWRRYGWHIFEFETHDTPQDAAFLIGSVMIADETYLNGNLIGQRGSWGDGATPGVAFPPFETRVYPIMRDHLNDDGANVIAVRVARHFTNGGLVGPVAILSRTEAEAFAAAENLRRRLFEAGLWGVDLLIAAVMLGAFLMGARGRAFLAFCIMAICSEAAFLLDGRTATELFGASLERQMLAFWLAGGPTLSAFLAFVALMSERDIGVFGRFLQIGAPMTLAAAILSPPSAEMTAYAVGVGFYLIVLLSLALALYWSVSAVSAGLKHLWPVILGLSLSWVTAALELTVGLDAFWIFTGVPATVMMDRIWLLTTALALVAHYMLTQQRLRAASVKVLDAQESERARLSRELHDGVGQRVALIQFELDRLSAGEDAQRLAPRLSDHAAAAAEDLRRVAHDLSPALTAKLSLEDALREEARTIMAVKGIELKLDIGAIPALSSRRKDHLYRIAQQCIRNAIAHGDADEIAVSLRRAANSVVLEISDRGRGFDSGAGGRTGLGLTLIHERAELIGGRATIEGRPGEGASIRVVAPVAGLGDD